MTLDEWRKSTKLWLERQIEKQLEGKIIKEGSEDMVQEKLEMWLKEAESYKWIWFEKEQKLFKMEYLDDYPLDLQSELDDVLGYGGVKFENRNISIVFQHEPYEKVGQIIVSIVWIDYNGNLHSILNRILGVHFSTDDSIEKYL